MIFELAALPMFGAFCVYSTLTLYRSFRTGKVPYFLFAVRPYLVVRSENPPGFWLLMAVYGLIVGVSGLLFVRALMGLATLTG